VSFTHSFSIFHPYIIKVAKFHSSSSRSFYTRLNFLPEYNELKPINEVIRAESGIGENQDFKNVLTLVAVL
jgi:hypothetical protein